MTRMVLKWDVAVDDQTHSIGAGAVVMTACQHAVDTVQVWTDEPNASEVGHRVARVYGTGQPVPDGALHLGSVVAGTGLVWHVYGSPIVEGSAERAPS